VQLKQKWLIQHLEHDIPGIAFEANSNRNHPKGIVSNDELTKKTGDANGLRQCDPSHRTPT